MRKNYVKFYNKFYNIDNFRIMCIYADLHFNFTF